MRRSSSRPRRPGWSGRRPTTRSARPFAARSRVRSLVPVEHERGRAQAERNALAAVRGHGAVVGGSEAGCADEALADGGDADPEALELQRVLAAREQEADVGARVA